MGKCEVNRPFVSPRSRRKDNIKKIKRNKMERHREDSMIVSQVVVCCVHGNEISVSTKFEKFLD